MATFAARSRRGPQRPGWSFSLEWAVEFLRRDWLVMANWEPARIRQELDSRPPLRGALHRVERRSDMIAGVDGEWFTPTRTEPDGVVVYLHGGAYAFGSSHQYSDMAARLALASGMTVYVPNYRLAPEHPYPAALDDALAIVRELRKKYSVERLLLAGDSAGGGLGLLVQNALLQNHEPLIPRSVLFAPWVDLTTGSASMQEPFDFMSREVLAANAKRFAATRALDDPAVSPLYGNYGFLRNTQIQVGSADGTKDECRKFVELARAQGAEIEYVELAHMPHAIWAMAAFAQAGHESLERAAEFLRHRA